MANFTLHTPETAPEGARDFIAGVEKKMGFVPSLYAVFAENPAVLDAYTQLSDQLAKTGLTPLEQQIVTITASVEIECHFCVWIRSRGGLGSDPRRRNEGNYELYKSRRRNAGQ